MQREGVGPRSVEVALALCPALARKLGSAGHLHFARDLNPWASGGKVDICQLRGWRARIRAGAGLGRDGAAELAASDFQSGCCGRVLMLAGTGVTATCGRLQEAGPSVGWTRGTVPAASSGRPPPGQVRWQVLRLRSGVGLLEAPCVGCRSVPRVRRARALGLLSPGAALSATLPLPLGRNHRRDFVAVVFSVFLSIIACVFLPATVRLCLF